ncbi:exopolyphosphatase [Malassezia brasiliensis]|uniref:Exopolyphosphatase n=1 Tax=Malassezia brasiliensis TaxID=1821822 RepID=A0AAF0IUH7_9BASI|nr:exopolyphosphatase [Malassezia brasiliensis]
MTEPPQALPAFLAWAKHEALAHLAGEAPASRLVLIMGNDAGDLDSAASAIALSYVLAHAPAYAAGLGFPTGTAFVPLVQTPRAELAQRRENLLVYEALGVPLDALLTIDDLGVDVGRSVALSPHANVGLGLVDHARLAPAWGTGRHVDLVVDHHEDDGAYLDARLRIVRAPSREPVGSCASLVADVYADALRGTGGRMDRAVADLLLSAIVLDTHHVRMAPAGKATPTDAEAFVRLVPASSFAFGAAPAFAELAAQYGAQTTLPDAADAAGAAAPGVTRDAQAHTRAWARALRAVKGDVAHLDTAALLSRDLKTLWAPTPRGHVVLGVASVPVSVAAWVSGAYRHGGEPASTTHAAAEAQWRVWWGALRAFLVARRIDVLVVLCAYTDPDLGTRARDLVLVYAANAHDDSVFSAVLEKLVSRTRPSLDLTPIRWR